MLDDGDSTAETDRIFDSLRAPHRRRLLCSLVRSDSDGQAGVPLHETLPGDADDEQYQTALVHNHLPRLDAYGYVDYDADRERVRPGPRFDDIAPLVELLCDTDDRVPGGFP